MSVSVYKPIDPGLLDAYDTLMSSAQEDLEDGATKVSKGLWKLYVIWKMQFWKARYDTSEEWVENLAREPWGPSRAGFYNHIKRIENMFALGATDEQVQTWTGKNLMAWLNAGKLLNGKGQVKKQVVQALEENGKTPQDLAQEIASMSPGQAARHVDAFLGKPEIFPTDVLYDGKGILMTVRFEQQGRGLVWMGTISIEGHQIVPEGNHPAGLPRQVADWLAGKLGIRLGDQSG